LIRILQTLGAYGFRGYYENKSHFLLSVPFALKNLYGLVDNNIPKKLPELKNVILSILANEELQKFQSESVTKKLKVTINSFSYKEGIPKDFSGNGGGFVFDCRALHNPGRYDKYKSQTGLDKDVIDFLKDRDEVNEFLRNIYSIVDKSVKNYSERKFDNLMINFGCTGGQHRSVFCAENLAKHLKDKFDIAVKVTHTQLNKKV
jgi:RNase adaptor protein for sRNA GlmZ degradation